MKIVVTRPDPAGSELCRTIHALGHEAIHWPTIAFSPPLNLSAMEAGIKLLGDQDWIIFVSPQAVMAAVPALRQAWPNLPPEVKFAAIGKGTAEALKAAGYAAIYPAKDWHAEGLLMMPAFAAIAGKKVAIVRGEGGREWLEPALRARDAKVISVIVYQRQVPAEYPHLTTDMDAIICTSYTSVENLKKMIGQAGWSSLKMIPLIVVSLRIKKLAYDLGFQTIWVAENASHDEIAALIKRVSHDRQ